MERGNVLVIGNSGVGKSTLINAVLGEDRVETGWGTKGTTKELAIYENQNIPFRLIDTVGFEPAFLKDQQAINAVKKWSKDSAIDGHTDNQINVIWFCVEGTSSKLFSKTLKSLSSATSMWKHVPIIVVITKSYSEPERANNIKMVNEAFSQQKRGAKNLRKIIPVVASTFVVNENAFAAPEGITELIDATNEIMPEGIQAAEKDLNDFKLKRKRAMAHGLTGATTAAAVAVGAVPIPFADAVILTPIEIAEVNALAKIYGINKGEESKQFIKSIVEVGTVSTVAKAAISTLKAIPGINIAASVLNAIIAGSFVAALGEGSIYAFEQVYLGKRGVEDLDWVKKVIEGQFSEKFTDAVKSISEVASKGVDMKAIAEIISDTFKDLFSSSES